MKLFQWFLDWLISMNSYSYSKNHSVLEDEDLRSMVHHFPIRAVEAYLYFSCSLLECNSSTSYCLAASIYNINNAQPDQPGP